MNRIWSFFAACLLLALYTPALAGTWTVTNLRPAGLVASEALGVSGGQQVGYTYTYTDTGRMHAALWSGTAGTWVDLNPAGVTDSQAFGVSGGHQVGSAGAHAALWSGTAASFVDLNPTAAVYGSGAYGVAGDQQVGSIFLYGASHAGLWSGTAASWVDLDPGSGGSSYAYGTSGSQQVGRAYSASVWGAGWLRCGAEPPQAS